MVYCFRGKDILQHTVRWVVEVLLVENSIIISVRIILSSTSKCCPWARTLRIVLTPVNCVMIQSLSFTRIFIRGGICLKVVYPICCGVDVHKTFLIGTIISTTDGVQLIQDIVLFCRATFCSATCRHSMRCPCSRESYRQFLLPLKVWADF